MWYSILQEELFPQEGVQGVTLGKDFFSGVRFFKEGFAFKVWVLKDPDFWKVLFVSFEKLNKREFLKNGIFSLPLDYYGKRLILRLRPFSRKIAFGKCSTFGFPT